MSKTADLDLPKANRNGSVKVYTGKVALPLLGLWTSLCIVPSFAQQINVTTETASTPATTGIVSIQGVPKFVRFTGTLTHSPAQAGTVRMLFSLYQEKEGQTPLWQEAQDVQTDAQGHFTVLLGSTRRDGLPLKVFSDGKAHWLGMQPQPGQGQEGLQQPTDDEERVLLVGVPYALKAADADTLGGKPASAYVLAPGQKKLGKASNAGTGSATPDDNANASGQAAIIGTGAANYIPLWLSGSTLGNSFLYQRGGNVGVGTTTPVSKFEVMSPVPATALEGFNNATSGVTSGVLGVVASVGGTAGIFNNLAGGPILSGRSRGIPKFMVDGFGIITAGGGNLMGDNSTQVLNVNQNGFGLAINAVGGIQAITAVIPAISGSSDVADGIVGESREAISVHALSGSSHTFAALVSEGGQVPAIIAQSGPTDIGDEPNAVIIASGEGTPSDGSCVMEAVNPT